MKWILYLIIINGSERIELSRPVVDQYACDFIGKAMVAEFSEKYSDYQITFVCEEKK